MNTDRKILNVNSRFYPAQSREEIATRAVLVAGEIGDYAVYVGHGSPEWVARFGDKISFEEAQGQFPVGLEKERYRQ